MIYADGSMISFTPDHSNVYRVEFRLTVGDTLNRTFHRIVGWALIARPRGNGELATELEPVTVDDEGLLWGMSEYVDPANWMKDEAVEWSVVEVPQ